MPSRMLCTDCGVTAEADTLLPGSDRVELVAWLLGAVLGWLYCARRHWLRRKACSACGGTALVREARAAIASFVAPPPRAPRILSAGTALAWPAALATPRQRLRAGAPAAGLATALTAAGLLALLRGVALEWIALAGLVWSLAAVAGSGLEWLRRRGGWAGAAGARAWDARGRRLRIEVV